MRDKVGEEYDGTVSGVANFGLFIQIESPFVEGLVRVAALSDDQYDLDADTQRLVGRRSGRQFALGDAVKVRIENVSVQRRKIDLALVSHRESQAPEVKPRPRKRLELEARKPLRPSPARSRDREGPRERHRRPKRRR